MMGLTDSWQIKPAGFAGARRGVANALIFAVGIAVGLTGLFVAARIAALSVQDASDHAPSPGLALCVTAWFSLHLGKDLYRRAARPAIWQDISAMIAAALKWGGAMLLLVTVIGGGTTDLVFVTSLVALNVPSRIVARLIAPRINRRLGLDAQSRMLIVGSGQIARLVAASLLKYEEVSTTIVGFVDDQEFMDGQQQFGLPSYRVADMRSLIEDQHVDHVLFAFSPMPDSNLVQAMRLCQSYPHVRIDLVPRFFELMSPRTRFLDAHGLPLLRIPADRWRADLLAKRIFDIVVGAVALVIASPLILVAALAIRLEGPGPIFYRQQRVGREGRLFTMYKLRSMRAPRPGEDEDASSRYTSVGRFLRTWSIDELPQLWNVLHGSMSLVGPRPEQDDYVRLFSEHIPDYPRRHRVRGGLTGLAQIKGLRGATSIVERARLDNFYIDHWTFWLDLKIILFTFTSLIARSQGYGGSSMFLDVVDEVLAYRSHRSLPGEQDMHPAAIARGDRIGSTQPSPGTHGDRRRSIQAAEQVTQETAS